MVAELLPGVAVRPVGALGALGGVAAWPLSTMVSISQGMFAPVPAVALGLAAVVVWSWSSVRSSMSVVGEMFERWVYPVPAVEVLLQPEST